LNDWCGGVDLDWSGQVDLSDLKILTQDWLGPWNFYEDLIAYWSLDEGIADVAFDYSLNNNDGTIYGATWIDGISGYALQFDGVNDYVNCGNDDSLNIIDEITIEAWVRPASYGGNIVAKGGSNNQYRCRIKTSNGQPWLLIGNSSSYDLLSGSSTIPLNEWTHLTFVAKSQQYMSIYVNGVLDGSKSTTQGIGTTSNPLIIGKHEIWDEKFNGIIDEVRIYNRALSEVEIQSRYHNP